MWIISQSKRDEVQFPFEKIFPDSKQAGWRGFLSTKGDVTYSSFSYLKGIFH